MLDPMAEQNALELFPIPLGNLMCNGIMCKHDATSGGCFIDINGTKPTSTTKKVE